MSGTEVGLFNGAALPAYLKNREIDQVTKNLMGGAGTGKRISIRGNVFRMISGGKEIAVSEERKFNVVVVNAAEKVARTYYAGAYDPEVNEAPDCWSADGDNPDKSVEKPQHKNCADCPQNVKGSGQGDTRACRFSRRLAVLLDNDLEGDVFQLTLPSQSIFGKAENGNMPLNAYAQYLAGFNVPVTAVVTEMKFDINSATPKLFFKAVRPLTEAEFATCQQQGSTPAAKNAITMTVAQTDGTKKLAKPEPAARKEGDEPKTKAAPAEEQAGAVAKETAAPSKRASKKDTPPPADKKDLKAVLDSWDE